MKEGEYTGAWESKREGVYPGGIRKAACVCQGWAWVCWEWVSKRNVGIRGDGYPERGWVCQAGWVFMREGG